MTCEQALDFEQKATNLWAAWVSSSDTEDPQEWDDACESYITGMDDLRQQFGITTNRPVAIQTSLDGVAWTTIWSGNEQDLAQPLPVAVTGTFTQLRSLWYPGTCGFIGPVQALS